MARSDFNWVWFQHDFTATSPTVTREFPIEGSQDPVDDAYLLIQVRGVSEDNHKIRINNTDLPGLDLQPAPSASQAWLLWMKHIGPGILKSGMNTITITRAANDDFRIGGVAINWREP